MLVPVDDFLALRKVFPVVDVRSPKEYGHGHIPHARNIPILNDIERRSVGIEYKYHGREEAISTGYRLVGPRFPDIIDRTKALGKELLVHCWRGGLRSTNYCQLVEDAGVTTLSLEGGYKAFRRKALEVFAEKLPLYVIGGCTGSGKTEVLQALHRAGEQIVDLEDLANHKGSAFGGLMMPPQPTTEQFQNELFDRLSQLDLKKRIWIEDESMSVGRVFLPEKLWATLGQSPLIELTLNRAMRVERLAKEYGAAGQQEFLDSMSKISRRLGDQHYTRARAAYSSGDLGAAIEVLLTYYDKAYRMGLEKNRNRILYRIPWDGTDANRVAGDLIREIPGKIAAGFEEPE